MYQQVYYTSCETGLSGYAGFQVNAATSGTPDEDLRRVEGLSAYEPPRSIGLTPTKEQIRDCPVNLCFEPGERPLLAHVTFTGEDYSGRFGNYFVHALIGDAPFTAPAIELWRSPLWTDRTSREPRLPAVGQPSPGAVTKAAVARLLGSRQGVEHLPALLAAVERALVTEERSVVIYDHDVDGVATWIAAVSYLLPPAMARRMSFTTYQNRPGYSRQHVIGTIPGTDFEPSPAAFESFYLFDFVNGRTSQVPDRPLVDLLARVGVLSAASLWRSAANLGDGTEEDLDAWLPVVLAARVLAGEPLSPADVGSVLGWLETTVGRLPARHVERLGEAVLRTGGRPEADLSRLAAVAATADAGALLERLEVALVDLQIRGDGEDAGPLRTPGGRDHATRLYHRHLANDNLAELARLLRLAAAHQIGVDPRLLIERGRQRVGPGLFTEPVPEAVRVLLTQPRVLEGVLDFLTAQPLERQIEVFSGARAGILTDQDVAGRPPLRRARRLAAARAGRADRVETALRLGEGRLDEDLMNAVWPDGPAPDEARRLLREGKDTVFPESWLARLAGEKADLSKATEERFALIAAARVDTPLSGAIATRVTRLNRAVELRRSFKEGKAEKRHEIFQKLAGDYEDGPIHDYLVELLPRLMVGLEPKHLLRVLVNAPLSLRGHYLQHVRTLLGKPGDAAYRAAATVFAVAVAAEHGRYRTLGEDLEKLLVERLKPWNQRAQQHVGRTLKRLDARAFEQYEPWLDDAVRDRRRLRWFRRT
ncbi:GTPase-associated protein 1-related protein [Thermomonospora umbrina]|uniref:Uncharacterized protein n=1 Tax=Thermomonospora umbrina TaxID=111806 RepID=A0A3D9SMQ4_9ACTN|nr:GTPase-associated protein 1-related protein [Thermomonospora umbrina]REE97199.1 hypothetical protein DFJ69_2661 [Thermomonospora umbrina]